MDDIETIEQQLDRAAHNLGVVDAVRKLEPMEARDVRRTFILSCCIKDPGCFYWDYFKPPEAHVPDEEGWRHLRDYAAQEDICYLLFNENDDKVVYLVKLSHIVELIGDCSAFEFYLTGTRFDWAVAFSHHRTIGLQGRAAVQYEARKQST